MERASIARKHREKRDQIVTVAKDLVARDGVAGCTVRAVAGAGGLSKSAVHYYFRDVEELVDAAMLANVEGMLSNLRHVGAGQREPRARLEAVVDAYLETFAEMPHAAFLWFEYWVGAGRRESLSVVEDMLERVERLLRELIASCDVPEPAAAAHLVLSWLLGTVVQQHTRPRDRAALHAELDRLISG